MGAYDPVRKRVVFFGGGVLNDTWTFDGTDWKRQPQIEPLPEGRALSAMAYDPIRQTCILWGGIGWDRVNRRNRYLDDTWEWNGSKWRPLFPLRAPAQHAEHVGAMAFSPELGRMVLAGRASPDTLALARPCQDLGRGHPFSGSPTLSCDREPLSGGTLRLSFPSASGLGAVVLSPGECLRPPLAIGPPLFCAPGSFYPDITISTVFGIAGFPPRLALAIPRDPRLLGQKLCVQGAAFQPQLCAFLTQGVRLTITQPY
jgi:hypothetical protein